MSSPENKSYLAAGINGISALSPWGGSRSTTPKPSEPAETELGSQRGGDHTVSHRHRLSLKSYPRDCPALNVQWFHAVDIPKRKPLPSGQPPPKTNKPPAVPKKYAPFSKGDSRAIETAFQKLCDAEDDTKRGRLERPDGDESRSDQKPEQKEDEARQSKQGSKTKVPVNEDYLFDVDVEERELAPAYWLGPVYNVRRGTWFYHEGSNLRPCDENLAMQLEEGYLKFKPWRSVDSQRSVSQPRTRPTTLQAADELEKLARTSVSSPVTPKSSMENLRAQGASNQSTTEDNKEEQASPSGKTLRLFGAHMNSVVTYQDASTAWLMTDDFLSRLNSTLYQRFAGGGHFAGVKLVRGYSDLSKKRESRDMRGQGTSTAASSKDSGMDAKSDRGTDQEPEQPGSPADQNDNANISSPSEIRRQHLERQISSLVTSTTTETSEQQEEEVRKREEQEIQDDYKDQEGDEQGREIEHLLLVTHGIGQRLGLRMDSVNFVHDVNTLRKTLKAVYASSADLQALNAEVDKLPKNCRVQVLPICWRHLLDFPKHSLKHNRREFDLGDHESGEDEEYPSLDDITVEGVPAVRNLITDLALDILLYQSPAYKGHITRIVLQECNKIYKLFKDRNPSFNGRVSLIGHSLGSAILFDILCTQRETKHSRGHYHGNRRSEEHKLQLDFDVDDFYALGSPIGLFQMLKGRTIAARHSSNTAPAETPNEATDDPFLGPASANTSQKKASLVEVTTSSPRCQQLFNIFHPTDPISYRLEPLVSPAMSSLKPQPLPYTKRGIFGAPAGQGLTGIGARVGQSVSGLWSSFSSGIASSLLNRSLGISSEDAGKLGNPTPAQQTRVPLSMGAGTNVGGGVIPSGPSGATITEAFGDDKKRRLAQDAVTTGEEGEHPPTLIDSELETLYSGFEKRRKSHGSDADAKDPGESPEWQSLEEQAKRLKREEAKVRALNSNGRVDYSIQEGAFDISLLASIASHLSYWADEDVSHFMISQLLARHRILKKSSSAQRLRG